MASDITREELDAKLGEQSVRADARFHEFLRDAEAQRREQRDEFNEFLAEARKSHSELRLEMADTRTEIRVGLADNRTEVEGSKSSIQAWVIGVGIGTVSIILAVAGLAWRLLATA
jgi:predicted phage gp36 major capsid-like protein